MYARFSAAGCRPLSAAGGVQLYAGATVPREHGRSPIIDFALSYRSLPAYWRIFVEAPAGAPEFTPDAVTLGMGVCQCTSLPDGAADESGYAGMIQDAPPAASVLQGMSMIITDAGQAVTDADGGITGMSSFIISRAERGGFTQSFNLLQARVQEMASPVAMTRTGVICP